LRRHLHGTRGYAAAPTVPRITAAVARPEAPAADTPAAAPAAAPACAPEAARPGTTAICADAAATVSVKPNAGAIKIVLKKLLAMRTPIIVSNVMFVRSRSIRSHNDPAVESFRRSSDKLKTPISESHDLSYLRVYYETEQDS
jgi:hypothetical protein